MVPQRTFSWFQCQDTLSELGQSLNYNVPGGKLNRGMSVVDSVEILKGRALTEDEYFKAAVLGWCVELVRFFNSE